VGGTGSGSCPEAGFGSCSVQISRSVKGHLDLDTGHEDIRKVKADNISKFGLGPLAFPDSEFDF
jgi:hypothetical protein